VNRTAGHRRAGDEFWHFRGAILELRTECARLPKFGGVHRGPLRIHEHHERWKWPDESGWIDWFDGSNLGHLFHKCATQLHFSCFANFGQVCNCQGSAAARCFLSWYLGSLLSGDLPFVSILGFHTEFQSQHDSSEEVVHEVQKCWPELLYPRFLSCRTSISRVDVNISCLCLSVGSCKSSTFDDVAIHMSLWYPAQVADGKREACELGKCYVGLHPVDQ